MNPEPETLETAAQLRAALGNVSEMTIWRWRQKFPDFPKVTVICGRNYYSPSDRRAFVAARAAETEAHDATAA